MLRTNLPKIVTACAASALQILAFIPGIANAQNDFKSGKTRISVSAGNSRAYNDNYFQLGLGAGYYPVDGLELGLDARSWLGGEIRIHEIAPSVTYVVGDFGGFAPYAGALYRQTFIEDRDNIGAYGARGGVLVRQSQNLHLRAGVAVLRYRDCNQTMGSDCTDYFPEFSAGLYF